ncbi:zinc finger FYVE domain-containing protein 1 isoform X3 [Gouania willdenowi]|uniref:zinc finger FYVE domain-containing protein 1 isoform X3 n=1 Tax=Gouania willdenowi TaxID=441366 RepID=UPI001054E07A|nr:zinc finger FYVE domain-containing protein 1-like isoform X3 [Gouania willdenowi]
MSDILMREMESLSISSMKAGGSGDGVRSFLLVDEQENLQVRDESEFLDRLGCADVAGVKVLSIFGNTGDGKSHTLNHILFNGETMFYTSKSPSSCTVGVWAAFNPTLSLVALDTEGLLGAAANQNQRMRLLLKVLAVSDIVVYRTRAERLHNDMFHFLSSASGAYLKHFTPELRALSSRCGLDVPLSCLGPAVIVFQETTHTQLLGHDSKAAGHADTLLQKRFHDLNLGTEAFSSVQYVGTQTITPPTDYNKLLEAVGQQVKNTHTRSPRQPGIVFRALEALSDRFCGELADDKMTLYSFFPDEYFTCSAVCLSCNIRCKKGMNHLRDRVPHMADGLCQFTHQYSNKVLICKKCYEGGREVIVVPKTSASSENPWLGLAKYAWSGYVLECASCGVIYRSRQYWMGNQDPESSVVRSEIKHVWEGTLVHCLQSIGISGAALAWFTSNLSDHQHFVSINNCNSHPPPVTHGVPQGLVLGPLLFTIYMLPLGQIITMDSTAMPTIPNSTSPPNPSPQLSTITNCIFDIKTWIDNNFLQLNNNKTELLITDPKSLFPSVQNFTLLISGHSVTSSPSVRNLGIIMDSLHIPNTHVPHH